MAHVAYPALAYLSVSTLMGYQVPNNELYVLMGSAVAPDLDFIFQLARGKWFDKSFTHHNWPSHIPIFYLPFFLLAYFTDNHLINTVAYGLFSHLFLDIFFVADGIKIFYPFYNRFFSVLRIDTNGKHGIVWVKRYKERFIFKLDIFASILLLSFFLWRWIQ